MLDRILRRQISGLRDAPVTARLMAVCIVVYVLEVVFRFTERPDLVHLLGLSGNGLASGYIWTLVTHQFLHGSVLHLLVNLLSLMFAGPEVERLLGGRRYLLLFLLSGVAGGLLQAALADPQAELIGASGAVCGTILAFTTAYPELQIKALLFFVIPVQLKARTLGYGLIGLSLLFYLFNIMPGIGHLAHLGGALAGWGLMRYFGFGRSVDPSRAAGAIDPEAVLRKLVRGGIDSLSPEERRWLEEVERRRRGGS